MTTDPRDNLARKVFLAEVAAVNQHLAEQGQPAGRPSVLAEISAERARQDAKWGEQNHPDGTSRQPGKAIAAGARLACQLAAADGTLTWRHVMREEIAEAFEESDPAKLRPELVQVAAVAVAWIEAIDRRTHTNEQTVRACNGCNTPAHPYLNCDQAQQAREAGRG